MEAFSISNRMKSPYDIEGIGGTDYKLKQLTFCQNDLNKMHEFVVKNVQLIPEDVRIYIEDDK